VQAWLLATQAIDRGACCPGLLCCPAARGRKLRCTTAAPTASCCWPPAPWRPATLQASTQLVHALVAGRFCCNPARQMTSYGTCPSSFGICPAVSQAHAPPPRLSHTLFLCWSTAAADCLFMETGLVAADRLYTTKREILEQLGLGAPPTPACMHACMPGWLAGCLAVFLRHSCRRGFPLTALGHSACWRYCLSTAASLPAAADLLIQPAPHCCVQARAPSSPSLPTASPRSSWSTCGWRACRTQRSWQRQAGAAAGAAVAAGPTGR
jgi:hypothetical protein